MRLLFGLTFLLLLAQTAQATCFLEYQIVGLELQSPSTVHFKWNMTGTATGCGSAEEFLRNAPGQGNPNPLHRWRQVGPNKMSIGPMLTPPIYIPYNQAGSLNISMSSGVASAVNWTLHSFRLSERECCMEPSGPFAGLCGDLCQVNPSCTWDETAGANPISTAGGFMTVNWDNIYDDDDHTPPNMCYLDDNEDDIPNAGYSEEGDMPSFAHGADSLLPVKKEWQGKESSEKEKEVAIEEEELQAIEKAVDLARVKKQQLRAEKK